MVWVLVFVGIGVAGLVAVVCFGVWLAHKAADVFSEVTKLGDQAAQLAELVGQIQPPEPPVAAHASDVAPDTSSGTDRNDIGWR